MKWETAFVVDDRSFPAHFERAIVGDEAVVRMHRDIYRKRVVF